MKNAKLYFHYISYLQYPLMIIGLFFAYKPFFTGFDNILVEINRTFIFMGLGISFSTLQDTEKTQNKLSLRVYQNPKWAKAFLLVISLIILFLMTLGLIGLFSVEDAVVNELSLGLIVLGIGMIGMLKSAAEMAENHRLID